jgi:hypothetical protein
MAVIDPDNDHATLRPSPPENEGDNGTVVAERKLPSTRTNVDMHTNSIFFLLIHHRHIKQKSNGQMLMNNKPQHKQCKTKRMPQSAQLKSLNLFYQRLRTRWLFDCHRSIELMCVMCESSCELVTQVISHHITNL